MAFADADAERDNHGIRHVIVLMLENRSYDHLLGYHPTAGTLRAKPETCPATPDSTHVVFTSDVAGPQFAVGPAHSHEQVMLQITGSSVARNAHSRYSVPIPAPMNGFIASYSSLDGVGSGHEIMHCFAPERAPVLSHLASSFAVFNHWFSSVPGETWPNRNFAHAGTSAGEVNISTRLYDDETIFDRLGDDWAVYHKGFPQVWAFRSFWKQHRKRRFRGHGHLLQDISDDNLRAYSFVEPDHGLQWGEHGDSQHPHENEKTGRSFVAGERLMAAIYNALVAKPDVFEKTLLVLTYDEHGGFFDHERPVKVAPPDDIVKSGFDFSVSGVRVPAIVVNPRIVPKVIPEEVDHTAIPRTVRSLFCQGSEPLGNREAASKVLTDLVEWGPSRICKAVPVPELPPRKRFLAVSDQDPLDELQRSLVGLALTLQSELGHQCARAISPEAILEPSPLEEAAERATMTLAASEQLSKLVADLQERL